MPEAYRGPPGAPARPRLPAMGEADGSGDDGGPRREGAVADADLVEAAVAAAAAEAAHEREPAGYPARWESDAVLSDGATVRIRPVRPADADAIAAFHERQSRESVSRRCGSDQAARSAASSRC